MGYPFQIASRYLAARNRGAFVSLSTVLAVLGVTLGVAALLTVMSVTGGFLTQFREKILGVHAHVIVRKYTADFREYREVMRKTQAVPGVVGVAPFTLNTMMITHGDRTATGVVLKGVDPLLVSQVLDLPKHLTRGSLEGLRRPEAKPATDSPARDPLLQLAPEPSDTPKPASSEAFVLPKGAPKGEATPPGGYKSILPEADLELPEEVAPDPCSGPEQTAKLPGLVLGITLAQNLAATVGSCVQITSPTIGFSYSGGALRAPIAKQFRVTAVFDVGFDQYDSKFAYCDLYEAQEFNAQGDNVIGVEAKISDIDQATLVADAIQKQLRSTDYFTTDWEELNHGLFTAQRIQRLLYSAVLALIIVVAAFTVIATLIMVVLEKKRDIAVLKTMGATDLAVLRVFLYQGSLIGAAGTCLGLLLGLAVCKGLLVYAFPLDPRVYLVSTLPVVIRPAEFLVTGTISLMICLLATVVPALYAARLRPAEGVRAE